MPSHLLRSTITLLGIALCVSSCSRTQTHALTDVTKPGKVILSKRPAQGPIHALHLRVMGEIDGSANLSLRHPGEAVPRTFTIHGKISQVLHASDWYADSVELEYTPSGVTRGNVKFLYDFSD